MTEPFTLPVEFGKTREFAKATGSRHRRHFEPENAVTPPTFLMTAAFWQTPESNAWPKDRDMRRVLHASQEFVFPKGPPTVGTVLTGHQRVEDSYSKEGKRGGTMTFTTLLTEYRDETGEVVAEVRNTLVETSKPPKADV
ncbi:MaoC family dehydratase N-terminal domain-containing protein [Mycolicibacterium sp.]|uniref:FAS1-like dehydratase domain-containing protein n=1 Tax=Mycolicibacterium sp. TaxID=2320850 RepID=UPI001A2434BA|nr:MaoC family dehydratase N-terminal domain-containing protein [Mycolicibacterium sp.]MBJ7336772.1 MaoC family dehydratase N-terminal domain-containing protein [Mycolicibacterium sp.]